MVALPKPRLSVADPDAFHLGFQKLSLARWNFMANRVPLYQHADGAWRETTRETLPGIVREHVTPVDAQGREVELPSDLLDYLSRMLSTPFRVVVVTADHPLGWVADIVGAVTAYREWMGGIRFHLGKRAVTYGPDARTLTLEMFADEFPRCAMFVNAEGKPVGGAPFGFALMLSHVFFDSERTPPGEILDGLRAAGVEVVQ